MYSVRGATTVSEDVRDEILSETKRLLTEIISRNSIKHEDIINIIFTATEDIKSVYPAVAARELGLNHVPLMCVQEMYVENSLKKCIRVLMCINKNDTRKVHHVYLNESKILRPDLLED